ncbi:response regulator transcription factor [Winogradskyella sp. PAMC22761]|nr:response regulator transcription factor [Winogradskyella sp. PAMC22761]
MKKEHHILIVDDHLLIIEGYKQVLKTYFSNFSDTLLQVDYAVSFNAAVEKVKYSQKEGSYDLIILDLSMAPSQLHKMNTGEDLGVWVRRLMPKTKLLVITSYDDTIRINNVLNQLNPEGFLLKSEIDAMSLTTAVHGVLENKLIFGKRVGEVLKNRQLSNYHLDTIDLQILKEISNGTKAKDLPNYVPMSKSGIEKRIRMLKQQFNVLEHSNRELVLSAREKGYI